MRAGETVAAGELLDDPARVALARWPVVIGWAAMLVFAFHACTHMVAAGDTWVAMACGRHFSNHGVDTVEPFSANSHEAGPTAEEVQTWPGWARWITDKVGLDTVRYWHPTGWVNQNWLTHVIFYRLTTMLGSEAQPYYNALVLWKFAVYLLAAVALYYTGRTYGVHPVLAAVFVCFALFIGRSFFDIRPAGFSNLLVAVLMLVLALASYRNALYVWLIVPLIVFWSNVHGGYVYAFIVLVPFVAWHLIVNLPRRWTIAAYGILTWLVLYGMTNRFLSNEHLTAVAAGKDWLLYLLLLAIGGSIALTVGRRLMDGSLIAYHVAVSCVLFLVLLPRFFPVMPVRLTRLQRSDLEVYIAGSRLAYLGIFSFAMLLGAVVVFLKEKVVRAMDLRGILHVVAAGAVAFVAMVVFNPFHLTNLTHTFIISVSKHAERWRDVHEWHRAFDWSNPVGTAVPFLVMYILAWLALIAWVVLAVRTARATAQPVKKRAKASGDYAWLKIDFGLVIIGALTIYMAIRSRRFIPIAGFAACPLIALLVERGGRLVAATVMSRRTGKFELSAIPPEWRSYTTIAGAGMVILLGWWWGLKFKSVYLDYWPADPTLSSVFMRMTASDAKPFYACQFIRDNQLSGKMFNYWTEGGFIAWGQEPDPETGRIPLQLFMDGRAQAAYDVNAFDLWTDIMSAGPLATVAAQTGRELTAAEYRQVGDWISEQLKKYDVWVVLMPNGQFDRPFTYGLEYSTDWRIVFLNDKQKLFVNVAAPEGAELWNGMFTGQTKYPNEYLANIAVGRNLLMYNDPNRRQKGLDMLVAAFKENPSPAPMIELLMAAQFPELRPRIIDLCAEYVQDFEQNKAAYRRQDGYNLRLEAARLATLQLERHAEVAKDTEMQASFHRQRLLYGSERDRIFMTKKW